MNYLDYTINDLKIIAKNLNLKNYSKLNKKDLINLIKDNKKGGVKFETIPKHFNLKNSIFFESIVSYYDSLGIKKNNINLNLKKLGKKFCKFDIVIEDFNDIIEMIETYNFWGIKTLPLKQFEYIYSNKENIKKLINDYSKRNNKQNNNRENIKNLIKYYNNYSNNNIENNNLNYVENNNIENNDYMIDIINNILNLNCNIKMIKENLNTQKLDNEYEHIYESHLLIKLLIILYSKDNNICYLLLIQNNYFDCVDYIKEYNF
jgi:hypothetical protein